MILPRGQVIHENLNTSFAQIGPLLEELKTGHFTGYILLAAKEYEGILLLDKGTLLSAAEEVKGKRRNGLGVVDSITAKAKERDGTLSLFQLPAELTQLLARLYGSDLLYKDLSTDLTSLDRLVAGLEGQSHTGYIDVRLSKSHDTATLFMHEGKVLEVTMYCQSQLTSGPDVLREVIKLATIEGALFSVYRARGKSQGGDALSPELSGHPEQMGLWQEVLQATEAGVDGATKPGTFLVAFKRACIDLANTFPFLDPFAAEFEYKDGKIVYQGSATAGEFNQGLSRCLAQCLRGLATQPGTKDLLVRLSSGLSSLRRQQEQRLAEVGLVEAIPEVFRH
jgi:hypothetical protein